MGYLSRDDYINLALIADTAPGLRELLNRNGVARLTVCPECFIDDFVHVEGCSAGDLIDAQLETIEDLVSEG